MVVSVWPIKDGVWSFREQPGAKRVFVRVPKWSELLEVRGLGPQLFVPSEEDPLQRIWWSANEVMREAGRDGGRFKLKKSRSLTPLDCVRDITNR